MPSATKTFAAIDKALEDNQEDGFRNHLGASIIGRKCSRELLYTFRWVTKKRHTARLLRLFDRGHKEEFRFIEWLRSAGVSVWSEDKDGEQFRISACGGHFGGSLDGVLKGLPDLPATPCLAEFKTSNDKSFKIMVAKKVQKAKYEHYVQMQIYMYKRNLKWALYMMINKNDDSLHLEFVRADPTVAIKYLARAKEIIFTEVAPMRISEDPSWFECLFCDHHGVCHGKETPEINCRTCANVTVKDDGTWRCTYQRFQPMDREFLLNACASHLYHPMLLSGVEVIGQNKANNSITLKVKDRIIEHGPSCVSSKDLVLK